MRIENSSKNWATAYDFPALDEGKVIKNASRRRNCLGQAFVMNLRRSKFSDPKVREAIGLLYNFEWSNESYFMDSMLGLILFGKILSWQPKVCRLKEN